MESVRRWLLGGVFLALVPSVVLADDAAVLNRLNKIFNWEMSNQLDLSPEIEKQMEQIISEIQTRRSSALDRRSQALECMKKGQDIGNCVSLYSSAIGDLSKLEREELERLKSILGDRKLAQYLIKRQELIDRVRQALQK